MLNSPLNSSRFHIDYLVICITKSSAHKDSFIVSFLPTSFISFSCCLVLDRTSSSILSRNYKSGRPTKEEEDKPHTGSKYLQKTYLIKDRYLKYTKTLKIQQ